MRMRDEKRFQARTRKEPTLKKNAGAGRMLPEERQRLCYSTKQWRELRAIVNQSWPECVGCAGKGLVMVRADCVDHILNIQQPDGFARRFDIRNLQPLCNRCHEDKNNFIDCPGKNPNNYRHDRAHLADMRPDAMKKWADDYHAVIKAAGDADDSPVTYC